MRVSEVTENNKDSMEAAFKATYKTRRNWILNDKPLVCEILQRFPRFRDSLFTVFFIDSTIYLTCHQHFSLSQVKLDFRAITGCDFDHFVPKWLEFEDNVILFLPNEVQEAIAQTGK